MTLLEQIQNEAVDGRSDLATVLRKCRVLASKLKNQEFTDWVKSELDGYFADQIPEYRILDGYAQGKFFGPYQSGVDNVPLLESDVNPKELRERLFRVKLNGGVATIVEMLARTRADGGIMRIPWPPAAIGHYKSSNVAGHLQLGQAWTVVSDNQLAGVLDTIRNQVLNFVLEVMEENPDAGEAPIGPPAVPPERTHQIFQNVFNIHGSVSNVAGGSVGSQVNVTTVRPGDFESLKAFLLGAGIPEADVAELKTAIAKEPGIRSIEASSGISGWWARTRAKITSGAIALAGIAGPELVKQAIDAFFQH